MSMYYVLLASSAACAALWFVLLFRAPSGPGRDWAALGCLLGAYSSLESALRVQRRER
jgi:hypothetical protein